MSETVQNTDRELWRLIPDDEYSPSIHVTQAGDIGINVNGLVVVRTIEMWHALAMQQSSPVQPRFDVATDIEILNEMLARITKLAIPQPAEQQLPG